MGSDPSIALSDNRIIQNLLQALETFLKLRGPIPLRELVIFLHIALDEGNEAIEYADRLKVHRAVMSKLVHDLTDRARGGGPGLGLIEFKYAGGNQHNRKPIFLTKKRPFGCGGDVAKPSHSIYTARVIRGYHDAEPAPDNFIRSKHHRHQSRPQSLAQLTDRHA